MMKLIVGSKGTGKTKQMVDLINESLKTNEGNIVCIEKSMKLTYDLSHKCRLIDMDESRIKGYDMLYGFIAGLRAGNYDINEIYVDGVLKVGRTADGGKDLDGLGKLLADLEALAGAHVKFVVTVSADEAELPESVKKFIA
jgi:hypothetical protein